MSSNSDRSLRGTWRTALGKVFLAAEDLEPGQELSLEISDVTMEQTVDPGTKKPKELVAIHFTGTDRVLALNVTNARRISEAVGSPRVEKWKGHKIRLHLEMAKAFGKDQLTLRVMQ